MPGPKKFEWLVILPDKEGQAEARDKATQDHRNAMKQDVDFWLAGGPIVAEHAVDGKPPQVVGSHMLLYAATKEDVIDRLKRDPFTKADVWDWDKIQIHPIISAARLPLPNPGS